MITKHYLLSPSFKVLFYCYTLNYSFVLATFTFNFSTRGTLTPTKNTYLDDITISVGFLAIAIDDPNTDCKGTVNEFDELCDEDATHAFFKSIEMT